MMSKRAEGSVGETGEEGEDVGSIVKGGEELLLNCSTSVMAIFEKKLGKRKGAELGINGTGCS